MSIGGGSRPLDPLRKSATDRKTARLNGKTRFSIVDQCDFVVQVGLTAPFSTRFSFETPNPSDASSPSACRFPERQRFAKHESTSGQLRTDGPDSRAPLGPAEHRPVRRRPRERFADGPRARRRLHQLPDDIAHRRPRYVNVCFQPG